MAYDNCTREQLVAMLQHFSKENEKLRAEKTGVEISLGKMAEKYGVLDLQVSEMTDLVDAVREYAAVFNMKSCGSGETGDTWQGLQIKRRMAEALEKIDAAKSVTHHEYCDSLDAMIKGKPCNCPEGGGRPEGRPRCSKCNRPSLFPIGPDGMCVHCDPGPGGSLKAKQEGA